MKLEENSIYIVEDLVMNRLMIETILKNNGFQIAGSNSKAENAWIEIQKTNPNLILLDINLAGEKDGLWLGEQIYNYLKTPVIYITAYEDKHTSDRILETHPMGFLVKPINPIQLLTTINIALNLNHTPSNNHIILQDGMRTINIQINDIIYLQSEGNYVHIYMENNHFLIRITLSQLLEKLPQNKFQRIHQRNAIHINKEFTIQKDIIEIKGIKLSISDKYKAELKNRLK